MARGWVEGRGAWSTTACLAVLVVIGGCSVPPLANWHPTSSGGGHHVEVGTASWYGPGFYGEHTSSGEIYTASQLTAAHQTLPLGTRVVVTNLANDKSIEVRINDRGPFAKGRIIDLSHAAAEELGLVGPGTAQVRVESIDDAAGPPGVVLYAVQAGAFVDGARASALRSSLADRFMGVYLSPLRTPVSLYYRVRVGPFDRRDDAIVRAREISLYGLPAVIVEEVRR